MKTRFMLLLAVLVSAAACASAGPDRGTRQLALALEHAGDPVRSIRIDRMQSWESLGDEALLLWTGPSRAYLLGLDGACHDLGMAVDIELKYQPPILSAGFDHVRVRDRGPGLRLDCRILEIRPVDVKAMKAAAKQAREAAGRG